MIKAEVIGSAKVEARLEELSKEMRDGIAKSILMLTIELQRIIQQDKLSGQVLHARTSNLRNSIAYNFNDSGNEINGTVGTNIGAIPYARIHEFGGIIEAKRANFLKFRIGDRWISKKSVVIPERSYLRSALKDLEPKIQITIKEQLRGFSI
jgi:phage gpG-like protein